MAETMVAALLLSFAAMIFGAACPTTSQVLVRGRNTDLASDACQRQLELWRQVGYNSLPAIPAGVTSLSRTFTPPSDLVGASGTVIFTRIDSNWADTTAETGRVKVDAMVIWGTAGIKGGRIVMTSIMRR